MWLRSFLNTTKAEDSRHSFGGVLSHIAQRRMKWFGRRPETGAGGEKRVIVSDLCTGNRVGHARNVRISIGIDVDMPRSSELDSWILKRQEVLLMGFSYSSDKTSDPNIH
jgi:hypothetical protein